MSVGIVAIRNGFVDFMATCGPWAASEISTCDFGVMGGVSGCMLMITPTGDSPIQNITRGTAANYLVDWNLSGELFIRYTGDSPVFLSKVWSGMDDIVNTIAKDTTFLGSACYGVLTGIKYDMNEGFELGGQDFGVIHFSVLAQDL